VRFGWATTPKKQKRHYVNYVAGSSFIELGIGINASARLGGLSSIYYRCRIPGHGSGTVMGSFRGAWSIDNDLSAKEKDDRRARVLLSAASRMSERLNCDNKPQVSPTSHLKPMRSNELSTGTPRQSWPDLPMSGEVQ